MASGQTNGLQTASAVHACNAVYLALATSEGMACLQEANSRATPSSPGRAEKLAQASSTSANAQQQVRKRNAAAKKKLQQELAEQTALVEKLQQQLAVATAGGNKVAALVPL